MNLYFLVEGVTEIILYRTWLKYLLPNFQQVKFHDQATQNCYYIIGDYGFPGILDDGIHKAIDNIQSSQKYDYWVPRKIERFYKNRVGVGKEALN